MSAPLDVSSSVLSLVQLISPFPIVSAHLFFLSLYYWVFLAVQFHTPVCHLDVLYFSPMRNGLASAQHGSERSKWLPWFSSRTNPSALSLYLHSTNSRVINESAKNGGHYISKEKRPLLTLLLCLVEVLAVEKRTQIDITFYCKYIPVKTDRALGTSLPRLW
jgi:hypothetical protein